MECFEYGLLKGHSCRNWFQNLCVLENLARILLNLSGKKYCIVNGVSAFH